MRVRSELESDLLVTARYGASSLLLAQASGGNNSVKDVASDTLWVKASGVRLRDVKPDFGMVALRQSVISQHIRREAALARRTEGESRRNRHECSSKFMQDAVLDPAQGRPSLEAGFHALLSHVVLHLHPVYMNAFSCMEGSRALLAHLAPGRFHWIEYATPGRELAVAIDQALSESDSPEEEQCFVLANHGFIASSTNAVRAIAMTEAFLRVAQRFFSEISSELLAQQPPTESARLACKTLDAHLRERWQGLPSAVRPATFAAFQRLAENERLFDPPGALFPDDVVYAGGGIRRSSLSGLRELVSSLPDEAPQRLAVAVEGAGTLLVVEDKRLFNAMEETLLAHVLVRRLIAHRGKPRVLPQDEVNYLAGMESERYRIRVAAAGAS